GALGTSIAACSAAPSDTNDGREPESAESASEALAMSAAGRFNPDWLKHIFAPHTCPSVHPSCTTMSTLDVITNLNQRDSVKVWTDQRVATDLANLGIHCTMPQVWFECVNDRQDNGLRYAVCDDNATLDAWVRAHESSVDRDASFAHKYTPRDANAPQEVCD